MIVLLALLAALFFALAVVGWMAAYVEQQKAKSLGEMHTTELASINKIGKWYQDRVEELENETRQLAAQVVASGGVVAPAMPLPPADFAYDYASDPTGLVVERLDPREAL
jgi:multidrug efflux pump subunit AcrB